MKIKSFHEILPPNKKQWYISDTDEVVPCDENIIQALWCVWVLNENENSLSRHTEDQGNFHFVLPIDIDFKTADIWC